MNLPPSMPDYPVISVLVTAYNRAGTIRRTLDSIFRQTYPYFEIVVTDDGSKDNTLEILASYTDERLRVIRHEKNRGIGATKNTCLDNIRGDWFVFIDSDDEMVSDALESMIRIPLELDNSVTAVTCNCVDFSTQSLTGKGPGADKYIDFRQTLQECTGIFWGITKTSLLMQDRLMEDLSGYENILWYRINKRANRYFLHRSLLVIHTEGGDRSTTSRYTLKKMAKTYQLIARDVEYLEILREYRTSYFAKKCMKAIISQVAWGSVDCARSYYQMLKPVKNEYSKKFVSFIALHFNPALLRLSINMLTFIHILD